jgi:hypothetical protein
MESDRKRVLVARWIESTILTTDDARKIDLHEYWRADSSEGSYKRYVWTWSRSLDKSLAAGIADAIEKAGDTRSVAQKRSDAIEKVETLITQGRFGKDGYLRTFEMKEEQV